MAGRLARAWLLFSVLLLPLTALAEEFRITELQARLEEGSYLVDAAIDYRFSEQALEALENGVPLTLEVHVQLRRKGAWIWEGDLLDKRLRYRIRYHALAGVYQVFNLQREGQESFVTREAALTALGRLHGIPLIERDKLKEGQVYNLAVRSVLDIEALPLPLRPTAYLTPAWNLSSDWRIWPLKP
jgi:hypothetical protein